MTSLVLADRTTAPDIGGADIRPTTRLPLSSGTLLVLGAVGVFVVGALAVRAPWLAAAGVLAVVVALELAARPVLTALIAVTLVPVTSGTVMGGSMGMMVAFSDHLSYGPLNSGKGTLVFYTLSAKDGSVIEASTVRVALAPSALTPSAGR